MSKILRIGTRDSQLAVWQATQVQNLLTEAGFPSELVYIKSEGDIDTITPLYALGVQGIFTKTLDAALLNGRIDLAVHSMKDVPTQMAQGIGQAAVLKRASSKDIFVYKQDEDLAALGFSGGRWNMTHDGRPYTIATSSVRRIAQWLHRYPHHKIEDIRGNVNTRLRKLAEHEWKGAIFAAAGLERIGLRPDKAVDLDWMLPAPAQGAIMIACREEDDLVMNCCNRFNDEATELCTRIERDFLNALMGGCSTPISALAQIKDDQVHMRGNILSPDGRKIATIEKRIPLAESAHLGVAAARELLLQGGQEIIERIRKKGLTADEA